MRSDRISLPAENLPVQKPNPSIFMLHPGPPRGCHLLQVHFAGIFFMDGGLWKTRWASSFFHCTAPVFLFIGAAEMPWPSALLHIPWGEASLLCPSMQLEACPLMIALGLSYTDLEVPPRFNINPNNTLKYSDFHWSWRPRGASWVHQRSVAGSRWGQKDRLVVMVRRTIFNRQDYIANDPFRAPNEPG